MKLTGRLLAGAMFAVAMPAFAQNPAAAPLPVAASPEAEGFSSERLQRLDDAMAQAVKDQKIGGALTLLARDGKVVAYHAYGDAAPGRPMPRDAIFRIYSMSKVVTGVAMMILFEEGKWRLDDPVTKYVPELAKLQVAAGFDQTGKLILEPMKRPPTMRELMSHTAGLAYGLGPHPVDVMFRDKAVLQANGLKDMIGRLSTIPLLYQPGERWSYSAAVDVQGYIVEKLSGMPFGQFLQQRVFAPLKMVDTGFSVPAAKMGRVASVYATDDKTDRLSVMTERNGQKLPDPAKAPSMESGGGGLFSTLDDYSRFAAMLANKGELDGVRLLAPATVELMQTNVIPEAALHAPTNIGSFGDNVGFGLDVMTITHARAAGRLEPDGTISWEGAAGTWFWADPANRISFVGMIQNFAWVGPNGFDPITRPFVYQALIEPSK